jgi:thioredoxin reductase (NADPH)
LVKRIQSYPNLKIAWNCIVDTVLGERTVMGVRLRQQDSGTLTEIRCSAVFPFIGTVPDTEFLAGALKQGERGRLVTDDSFATSQPGIYAAGAVRRNLSGELCSAAGEGDAAIKTIAALFE